MTTEAQVLYVHDMARVLGRTEASIRAAVNRARAANKWPAWLPPIMNTPGSIQWYRPAVDQHLKAAAEPPKKKGGRS